MGSKDGEGVEGISHSTCKDCLIKSGEFTKEEIAEIFEEKS